LLCSKQWKELWLSVSLSTHVDHGEILNLDLFFLVLPKFKVVTFLFNLILLGNTVDVDWNILCEDFAALVATASFRHHNHNFESEGDGVDVSREWWLEPLSYWQLVHITRHVFKELIDTLLWVFAWYVKSNWNLALRLCIYSTLVTLAGYSLWLWTPSILWEIDKSWQLDIKSFHLTCTGVIYIKINLKRGSTVDFCWVDVDSHVKWLHRISIEPSSLSTELLTNWLLIDLSDAVHKETLHCHHFRDLWVRVLISIVIAVLACRHQHSLYTVLILSQQASIVAEKTGLHVVGDGELKWIGISIWLKLVILRKFL